MFALGRLPIQQCGWMNTDQLRYKGETVELQVTGIIWDLNFSMKMGQTAEYDMSVAFIRRGDKNALGDLIHTFKPTRKLPFVFRTGPH